MKKPLISLITPTYNDLKNLKKLIKNLNKQTFKNFEHIIADGGSTDGTVDYLKANRIVDKIITSKDLNMYRGLNKAIDICDGKIIGYINADDQFNNKDYFKIIATTFENKKVECIYSCFEVIDLKANKKKIFVPLKIKKRHLATLGMPFCQHCFFWSSKFKKFRFNLKYSVCADYDFIGNIILRSKKIAYYKSNTSSFFKRHNSFGERNHAKGINETNKIKGIFKKKTSFNFFYLISDRFFNFINNFKKLDNNVYIFEIE